MSDEIEITLAPVAKRPKRSEVFQEIWRQMTAGVGLWGTMRPAIAALLALVPFLYLGQHFNHRHRKAGDWTLLQIPLALTGILFIVLWVWSIVDAWTDSTQQVAQVHNNRI